MNRTWLSIVAIAAGISFGAQATPVFLKCTLNSQNDGSFEMNVQLNEDTNTATYTFPDEGRTVSVRALFSPDIIAFNSFFVDRRTLAFRRKNEGIIAEVRHDPPFDYGTCTKDTAARAL